MYLFNGAITKSGGFPDTVAMDLSFCKVIHVHYLLLHTLPIFGLVPVFQYTIPMLLALDVDPPGTGLKVLIRQHHIS